MLVNIQITTTGLAGGLFTPYKGSLPALESKDSSKGSSNHKTFHAKIEVAGMTQSISRVAKCIDNGPMEGLWGIIKRERYYSKRFTDRESLIAMIEKYISYYNNKCLQRNLGVLTQMKKHKTYLQVA